MAVMPEWGEACRGVTSPFCLGGCLLELPCETDDALQQKFFFVNIFPKKVGERGGGGGRGRKKNFPDIQKKKPKKNFSGHKPVKLRVKKFFSDKFLFKHT